MKLKHFHLTEVSSTNDLAKDLLEDNDLVAVTADFQTNGRGRNERTWVGNSGENVYCSIAIRHKVQISFQQVMLFQVLGAMLVVKILRNITNNRHQFKLKYPNDVMAVMPDGNYGKICGVLAEHSFQGEYCSDSIIGIGVNVNQVSFSNVTHNTPTSLKLLGENFESEFVAKAMIDSFMELYHKDLNEVFAEWKQGLNFINKTAVIVGQPEEWIIENLLDDCRVELRQKNSMYKTIIDNGDSIRYALD